MNFILVIPSGPFRGGLAQSDVQFDSMTFFTNSTVAWTQSHRGIDWVPGGRLEYARNLAEPGLAMRDLDHPDASRHLDSDADVSRCTQHHPS